MMLRLLIVSLLAWMIVGTSLTFARHARADDESVIVVDIGEGISELEADRLRAAIAQELHAPTVKPSDPRSPSARGTVTIDVDRPNGKLSVTYLARTTPITRQVPLPADAAAARSAAVVLAGNLARDEASQLAAELRKQTPGVEERVPARPADRDSVELTERSVSAARLQGTLDYLAAAERHHRTFAWTTMFVGGVAAGLAVSELGPKFETVPSVLVSVMASTVSLGVWLGAGAPSLYDGSVFDKLADTHRKGAQSSVTEDRWRRFAERERSLRRGTGIAELSFSALAVGAGSVALAKPSLFTSDDKSYAFAGVMFAAAITEGVLGMYYLTTEGPVGSALHVYEQSTGRIAPRKEAWLEHLKIGFVPGGATGTFAVTF